MELSNINTIEGIADDVISKMSDEDKVWVTKHSLDNVCAMHHSVGQWIRNTYGLWHTNALTESWRTKPETHDIRGGVDYSADHPDAVSNDVLELIWKKLTKAVA